MAYVGNLGTNKRSFKYCSLSILVDHVTRFQTTVNPSSGSHFQQDSAPMINWFIEDSDTFSVLKLPSKLFDIISIEHFCDVVERETQILDV